MDNLTMSVKELATQMGISLPKAYELTEVKDFYPVIKIGRSKVILKEQFMKWLSENAGRAVL